MSMHAPDPVGEYDVTMSCLFVNGARHEETSRYRGNPLRDPDAELLSGRDLVRGDNAIYMNSSAPMADTRQPPMTIEWPA